MEGGTPFPAIEKTGMRKRKRRMSENHTYFPEKKKWFLNGF
jgi:hypothetical protein